MIESGQGIFQEDPTNSHRVFAILVWSGFLVPIIVAPPYVQRIYLLVHNYFNFEVRI